MPQGSIKCHSRPYHHMAAQNTMLGCSDTTVNFLLRSNIYYRDSLLFLPLTLQTQLNTNCEATTIIETPYCSLKLNSRNNPKSLTFLWASRYSAKTRRPSGHWANTSLPCSQARLTAAHSSQYLHDMNGMFITQKGTKDPVQLCLLVRNRHYGLQAMSKKKRKRKRKGNAHRV